MKRKQSIITTRKLQRAASSVAKSASSRISAPVATSRSFKQQNPVFTNSPSGTLVTMREYVRDVHGSTGFSASKLEINASRSTLFPWLSQVASRYEEYRFQRLSFSYEPRCSTQTAGTVLLAVDWDPRDYAPDSKQEALTYSGTVSSAAWQDVSMIADQKVLNLRGFLYNRVGAVADTDIKTYDVGNLFLCTSGFAGTDVCGELYVSYTVELRIPSGHNSILYGSWLNNAGLTATTMVGTVTSGTLGCYPGSILDVEPTSTSAFTFHQPWEGLVLIYVTGTGLTNSLTATGSTGTATPMHKATSGTVGMYEVDVAMLPDQVLNVQIGATTVSEVTWEFAPRPYSEDT